MKSEDLAASAMALECEGSITFQYFMNAKGWLHTDIRIAIANTDKRLIDYLLGVWNTGRVYCEEPRRLSKRKIYRWKLSSGPALNFLKLVRPYMKWKMAQADLAIYFQENRRSLSREQKYQLWQTMKALNRGESPAETERDSAETNLLSDSPTLVETLENVPTALLSVSAI